jgi:tRNA (cmo5U34)-methyltransferase
MDDPSSASGHFPSGAWVFDEEVTRIFEDMLRRSIPQLETMRGLVCDVGRPFVQPDTDIVDLGCSRGDSLAPFVDAFGPAARYVGVDTSVSMLEVCRRRFHDEIDAGILRVAELDLRESFPDVESSLTLAVLTMHFIPLERRLQVIQDVYERTLRHGAFILVEKVLGGSAHIDRLLTQLYEGLKRRMGYTQEEIDRKRLSLEGVLVPAPAAWTEDALRQAGFRDVECFWRCLNFAAWVAVKED